MRFAICDVSSLVNKDGGEDVGMLVKEVDRQSVVHFGEEIREAGKRIRFKNETTLPKSEWDFYLLFLFHF